VISAGVLLTGMFFFVIYIALYSVVPGPVCYKIYLEVFS
jgi:hypothetical protein